MKILFISRAYPPIVGGIENQNYELGKWLGKIAQVKIIANKKGKIFLPLFLPYAIIKSLLIARKYDAILLGDGVLGIATYKLKFFFPKKPIICVVHGLDLTFKSAIYQKLWVNIFLKHSVDKFIAVGNETVKVAKEKGITENKVVFIPNGVDTEKNIGNHSRQEIEKIIGETIENKKFLLTSGRLAKRKGAAWFIRNVLPKLPENVIYIIAGDGPDKENIHDATRETKLESRVKLLGYVEDNVRNILFNACDLFIQPNIKVPSDMEGFGISVIEAASCKIPVIASNLEGLKDAIINEENGFLVESENTDAWIRKINELLADDNFRKEFGEKARQFVIENYRWEIIAEKYLEEIENIIKKY
ncbi:MAG: glycosyltransferase family 4 protein [Parcubacteria group bacterium]|jgi:phosphatidylinositol alpha-1,6-mannosyltransferase